MLLLTQLPANTSTTSFTTLLSANPGGEFLLQHVKLHNEKRCYYAVTEEGKPLQLQNRPFTELFFIMAMTELYRATGDSKYQVG